jgi:hypothetical protein
MCKISYKVVKNESYQNFANICKPNVAYFTSILQNIGPKWLWKNLSYQTTLNKSNENIKCASYIYLYLQIYVPQYL